MSDIPITGSSGKVVKPIESIQKSQKTIQEQPQMEENPYTGSTEPINPEHLIQIKKDLANLHIEQPKTHASVLKEFSKKDLERIKQELANLSPKQLQDLVNQLKNNLNELQATLTELKKQKKVDPDKADFILDILSNLSSKDLQNLSKEDQEQLSNTLDTLKEKVTDLITNKQVEPEIGNILILFLAFAKTQMDQNDKAMLAGIQQTKVKTTQLELQAEKQKDIASQSTQGKHFSYTYAAGWVAAAVVIGGVLAFFTGGLSLIVTGAVIGAAAGTVGVAATGFIASENPESAVFAGITEEGPDQTKTNTLQSLLAYCNTQTQKLSSQLGSTQKMFVENISDRSSQLGQQSGQAITEMGEIMKSR